MKKIVVITPIKKTEQVRCILQPMVNMEGIQLDFQGLNKGIEGIATFFDRTIIAPQILNLAYQAEQNGADAVIINCMSEPALQAAKELLSIPVVGIFEAMLPKISSNGSSCLIVMPNFHQNYLQMLRENIKIFGLHDSSVSFNQINIEDEEGKQKAAIAAAIKETGLIHHTQSIVLSSTYLARFRDFCCQTLKKIDYSISTIIPFVEAVNFIWQIFDGKLTYDKANLLPPKVEKVKQWREEGY